MFLAVLAAAAALSGADPAGLWRTPGDGGVVEIRHCGQSLCARLVTSDRLRAEPGLKDARNRDEGLRGRALKGVELFAGFVGVGGDWQGGAIYNPHDGGTYHGSLAMQGADALKVTGCIFAPLCKTQVWVRAR